MKYTTDEAVIKIKTKIDKFYEEVGREALEDVFLARVELVDDIDDILDNTQIDNRKLIIERFESDRSKDEDGTH